MAQYGFQTPAKEMVVDEVTQEEVWSGRYIVPQDDNGDWYYTMADLNRKIENLGGKADNATGSRKIRLAACASEMQTLKTDTLALE